MSSKEERLAARALELCRIKSPTGQEKELADFVERWALGLAPAMPVFRCGHSLVVGALDDPRPTVALVGHLDTVPEHENAGPPRVEGDRLIARGASDMKGGLAVMMELAHSLPRAALPMNLALVFYDREEGSYHESGMGPLLAKMPGLGTLAFAVVLEPTDGAVQVGCMGTLQATVRFLGKTAHSARPWQGENAIHKAGPLLELLRAMPRREVCLGGLSFYEVMSVTTASGGRARNVVPDRFELNLNFRFAPGKGVDQAWQEVQGVVGGSAEVELVDFAPAGRVCAENPLYRKLLAVTGRAPEAKQAWTDVARFGELGVDAVNFGPGETAQAHQQRESASVASITAVYERLAEFLTRP